MINDSSEFPPYNPTNKIEYLGTNSDNRSVGSDSMDVTDTWLAEFLKAGKTLEILNHQQIQNWQIINN